MAFVASSFADGSAEGDVGREELVSWGDRSTSPRVVISLDFRRCIFALVIELEVDLSCSISSLERVNSSCCSCHCCCLCMNAGLGLIVGVAPVSCTIRTWIVSSFSDGVQVDIGSSPIEDAEDWEKRVDFEA